MGNRGVGDFVRLLDRVRHDRALGLLAIPRTVAPQALCQRLQVDERLGKPSIARLRHALGQPVVVVAESVAAAGGAYPVAYETFLAKKLLVSAVHFVIASVFALSRSVA